MSTVLPDNPVQPEAPAAALIGKIERIALRDVWKHEAHHFTAWLAQHLEVLSEAIGPDLTLVEREAAAGEFSVDLLAEDADGGTVIIENQLGKSDHDHLGKLLTYMAAFEASTAVWVVGEPRPEHTKAVAWLNDSSPADVYLLRAEAVRIGGSPPALLLTPIVGPSEQAKAVAKEKQEKSERHELRKQFWTNLLAAAAPRTSLHSSVSPGDQNWLGMSAGRSGLALDYVTRQRDWRVELYIDVGDGECNERLFDSLAAARQNVEEVFGGPLEWQRLEGKRACRITTPWREGGYRSEAAEPSGLYDAMIDAMIRLERSLRPHLEKLPPTESFKSHPDTGDSREGALAPSGE